MLMNYVLAPIVGDYLMVVLKQEFLLRRFLLLLLLMLEIGLDVENQV